MRYPIRRTRQFKKDAKRLQQISAEKKPCEILLITSKYFTTANGVIHIWDI